MEKYGIGSLRAAWRKFDLVRQFLVIGSVVFLIGMGIIGAALSQIIERGVVQNTASATALYFESFIAPLVQDLATENKIPLAKQSQLGQLIKELALAGRVISFKIWIDGSTIAYALDKSLAEKTFPMTPNLRRAWEGNVMATFEDLNDLEDQHEKARNVPLLEIYAPIRQRHTDRIIAVAEFYETAENLKKDVIRAQVESWLMIAALAAAAIIALHGVVLKGARTINRQRSDLQQRVEQLSLLLDQNDKLRRQVQVSSRRAADINEGYLRRFGSELHDGPAQLVGLALLRIDSVGRSGDPEFQRGQSEDIRVIRSALKEALDEVRNLSAGLSLPDLEPLSLAETLRTAVRAHIQRSKTKVAVTIGPLPSDVPHAIKAAAFRFVQEALNNATRHAGALGQEVRARHEEDSVIIEVCDSGPGFDIARLREDQHLGLEGLRERMRSLRGSLEIRSGNAIGTRLVARIPLEQEEIESG